MNNDRLRSELARKSKHVRDFTTSYSVTMNRATKLKLYSTTARLDCSSNDWCLREKGVKCTMVISEELVYKKRTISLLLLRNCKNYFFEQFLSLNNNKLFNSFKAILKKIKHPNLMYLVSTSTVHEYRWLDIFMRHATFAKHLIITGGTQQEAFDTKGKSLLPLHKLECFKFDQSATGTTNSILLSKTSYFSVLSNVLKFSSLFRPHYLAGKHLYRRTYCRRIEFVTHLELKHCKWIQHDLLQIAKLKSLTCLRVTNLSLEQFARFSLQAVSSLLPLHRLKFLKLEILKDPNDKPEWDLWLGRWELKLKPLFNAGFRFGIELLTGYDEDQVTFPYKLPHSRACCGLQLMIQNGNKIPQSFARPNAKMDFRLCKKTNKLSVEKFVFTSSCHQASAAILSLFKQSPLLFISDRQSSCHILQSFNSSKSDFSTSLKWLAIVVTHYDIWSKKKNFVPVEKLQTLTELRRLDISERAYGTQDFVLDLSDDLERITKCIPSLVKLQYFNYSTGFSHILNSICTLLENLLKLAHFERFRFAFVLGRFVIYENLSNLLKLADSAQLSVFYNGESTHPLWLKRTFDRILSDSNEKDRVVIVEFVRTKQSQLKET